MATKGQRTRNPGYQPGNNWDTCQRCGFEYRASDMLYEWNGLRVCDDCWESRHPQDFLRVDPEKIVPDWIGTEDPTDVAADPAAEAAIAANQAANAECFTVPPGTNDNTL